MPGKQFSSLAASNSDQVAQDIMEANTDFMEGLYETMVGLPLWKICQTRGYRKLESSHEVHSQVSKLHMDHQPGTF